MYTVTLLLLKYFYLYMTRINTIIKFMFIYNNYFKNCRCKYFKVICLQIIKTGYIIYPWVEYVLTTKYLNRT